MSHTAQQRRWKAVVTDLDGTLLNDAKQVSERSLRALERCHASGMRIIIATARPPRTVRRLLPERLLRISALVCYNGAYAACTETGLSVNQAIEPELSAEIIDFVLRADPEAELSMESEGEWFALRTFDHISDNLSFVERPSVIPLDAFRGKTAAKLLVTRFERQQALIEAFGSRVHLVVTDNGELVQMMANGVSKENTASRLCRLYGIDPADVVAFGDDFNDLGMFGAFGCAVATANAVPELKAAADEVTASNEADGVAVVLERLLAEEAVPEVG